MRIPTAAGFVLAAASGIATPAEAGTGAVNMTVSATVMSTCQISVASLGFGVYDPLAGGQVDGSASVSVACTRGATAAITLSQGDHPAQGSSDAAPSRRMTAGDSLLSYNLYSDASRAVPWGNTAATGKSLLAASREPTEVMVYGRIAAHQDVPSGAFTDVVVATISF